MFTNYQGFFVYKKELRLMFITALWFSGQSNEIWLTRKFTLWIYFRSLQSNCRSDRIFLHTMTHFLLAFAYLSLILLILARKTRNFHQFFPFSTKLPPFHFIIFFIEILSGFLSIFFFDLIHFPCFIFSALSQSSLSAALISLFHLQCLSSTTLFWVEKCYLFGS